MSPKNSQQPHWTASNSAGFEAPAALAVDIVVLTVRERAFEALVVRTATGETAVPGGFVGREEDPLETAARKLAEKTGLERIYLEQLGTFAQPHRDQRGWIPTVAHVALVPPQTEPTGPDASWVSATQPPPLAYDHDQILATALERVRGKLWWSNVAVGILPGEFTLTDARLVYEAIADSTYDPSTFARDLRATGLISATGGERALERGRPATLYRYAQQDPAWGAGRRKRVTD